MIARTTDPSPHSRLTEFRAFISSTFPDMHAEREQLMHRVIPELRRQLTGYGPGRMTIDLRWGLAPAHTAAQHNRIVAMTLDEITRLRPFCIALIGTRYSRLPAVAGRPADDIPILFPWLDDATRRRTDLPEIDLIEGILHNPLMEGRLLFYHRIAPPDAGATEAQDERTGGRIIRLTEQIRQRRLPLREYHDADSFGAMVREDLLAALARIHPTEARRSSLESCRHRHALFADTRLQGYVELPSDMAGLDDHIEGRGTPLVITGPRGAGKSSLLACWCRHYRRDHPDAFLIAHHVEAEPSERDHATLIRRIMGEIREHCRISAPLPTGMTEIAASFPAWLAQIQQTRLVLVIDGLDLLDDEARQLDWLPRSMPPNVRMIVSAADGDVLDTLRERGWTIREISPLSALQRRTLTQSFLQRIGISFSTEQVEHVAGIPAGASPLALKLKMEELQSRAEPGEHRAMIEPYLRAGDPDEIFDRMLERLELEHGVSEIREILLLLWASHQGLSETELLDLTQMKHGRLSPILLTLSHQLLRRQGLLTFLHDHLRHAIERRYIRHRAHARKLHERLARYFMTQPACKRRIDEEPWGWQGARMWTRLRECLTTIPVIMQFLAEEGNYELLKYWLLLGGPDEMEKAYAHIHEEAAGHIQTSHALYLFLDRFGIFLHQAGSLSLAERVLRHTASDVRQLKDSGHFFVILTHLTEVLLANGSYTEAAGLCRTMLESSYSLLGEDHPQNAEILNNLGLALHYQGNLQEAEDIYRRALRIEEKRFGDDHPNVAERLHNLGTILNARKEFATAATVLSRTVQIRQQRLGEHHPLTLLSHKSLGVSYSAMGRHEEAEGMYRRILEIEETVLGTHHPHTAQSALNLGVVLRKQGRHDEAAALYHQALAGFRRTLGPAHRHVAVCLHNLGMLARVQGRLAEAEALLREALAIYTGAFGALHPQSMAAEMNLASTLIEAGREHEAREILERLVSDAEKTHGADHATTRAAQALLRRMHDTGAGSHTG